MLRPLARTTALAAIALTLTTGFSPFAAAETAPTGWVRVGHLSPDTPPVDIYIAALDGSERETIRKAAYGTLSQYSNLQPGEYTVAMRPAGAEASSAAMLSWTVRVDAGSAATVLAVGKRDQLRNAIVTDDLTPPTSGNAKVRLIQGAPSQAKVDVTAVGGPALARGVAYGTATGYAEVPMGRWTLEVKGDVTSSATVDAESASVQSLLVLDKPGGGFEVKAVTDGSGIAAMPTGGVETGAGGTAPAGLLGLGGTVLVLVGGASVLVRRRVVAPR